MDRLEQTSPWPRHDGRCHGYVTADHERIISKLCPVSLWGWG